MFYMDTAAPITIIPCSGEKGATPARAAELYVGAMFRNTLSAAREISADANILILSALYGLVTLDTVLAPYDVKMGDAGSVSVELIAAQAAALGIDWGADVYALLPGAYFDRLDKALRTHDVYAADVYEADAGIGYQRGTLRCIRANADIEIPEIPAA